MLSAFGIGKAAKKIPKPKKEQIDPIDRILGKADFSPKVGSAVPIGKTRDYTSTEGLTQEQFTTADLTT